MFLVYFIIEHKKVRGTGGGYLSIIFLAYFIIKHEKVKERGGIFVKKCFFNLLLF